MTTLRSTQAQDNQVRGLVAPTNLGLLLLPTAAVAEVVSYAGDVQARQDGPEWLVGDLEWRDRRVPLVDLGATMGPAQVQGQIEGRHQRPCALICFTLSGNRTLPYLAILVPDSPRLVRLDADDLSPAVDPPPNPFAIYALEYRGSPAWVPDLDLIERKALLLVSLAS